MVRASPNTRRSNRWTNADAASRSPAARPATRVSSDTVHTAVLRRRERQGLHGDHGSGAIPRRPSSVDPPYLRSTRQGARVMRRAWIVLAAVLLAIGFVG